MYHWSANNSQPLVLIAGHTHHAVFMSETRKDYNTRVEDNLLLNTKPNDEKLAIKKAFETWLQLRDSDIDTNHTLDIPVEPKPTYFNTGCCAFVDGEITRIEISEGMISLVKWSGDSGMPQRNILRKTELRSLFERVQNKRG